MNHKTSISLGFIVFIVLSINLAILYQLSDSIVDFITTISLIGFVFIAVVITFINNYFLSRDTKSKRGKIIIYISRFSLAIIASLFILVLILIFISPESVSHLIQIQGDKNSLNIAISTADASPTSFPVTGTPMEATSIATGTATSPSTPNITPSSAMPLTATPTPSMYSSIDNNDIALSLGSVEYLPKIDTRPGAVFYNLVIVNKTEHQMIVTIYLDDIFATDNQGNNYVDYISKQSKAISEGCALNIGGLNFQDNTIQQITLQPHAQAIYNDPQGLLYLVKDMGCAPSNSRISSQNNIIEVNMSKVTYTVGDSTKEINPAWQLTGKELTPLGISVLPYFMIRAVTEQDLENKDQFQLDVMRNEIFARYGRQFQRPDLREYFNEQSWYEPRYSPEDFPDSLLTDVQKRNVEFILEYQNRK